jgi:hypothetical protein
MKKIKIATYLHKGILKGKSLKRWGDTRWGGNQEEIEMKAKTHFECQGNFQGFEEIEIPDDEEHWKKIYKKIDSEWTSKILN